MNEEVDKTKFTIEHAQLLYQTLADIIGEKYNVTIVAKVTKKKKTISKK